MTSVAGGALTSLIDASAMLLVPATMGFSTVLCLARAPSPYTVVALHEYLRRTRVFERMWLIVAVGWIGAAIVRGQPPAWTAAVAVAALGLVGVHMWQSGPLHRALAALVEATLRAGPVTTVSDDGTLVARRRSPEDGPVLALDFAVWVLGGVLLACCGIFAGVALAGDRATFGLAVLLGGFWLSLGVIGIDLFQDVWPGTTSRARLAQCSRYYVQVFEQWKNLGVLAGFGTVLIGAPIAYAAGRVGAAVLAFPVWIGVCLVLAIFVNQVLYRKGRVGSRLPLPVWVNEYSATRPLWAHFFTVIHAVMAAALLAGIAAINIALA
ncbi:hypothetical protein [Mycobacterium spongiae]|uniref:Uncharacterized protein n=1 Tax=Mycobacterium spongiae TaxID=886343 RepID=A0A975PXH0_9MYCO|nr:hypothetical protein [Mycobacterium spongiae]QUR67753.1 hypothetical protein F6B93_12155 [Mycobacterium spongiae]